jgi:DnaJ-class molecular chaperone
MSGDSARGGVSVPAATGTPSPGDETEPNASQTAENTCPACGGSGNLQDKPCPDCEGTGLVTVTVGDA